MQNDYKTKAFYHDLTVISNEGDRLYFAKHPLVKFSNYFISLLSFNNEFPSEIKLDETTYTLQCLFNIIDASNSNKSKCIKIDNVLGLLNIACYTLNTMLFAYCINFITEVMEIIIDNMDIVHICNLMSPFIGNGEVGGLIEKFKEKIYLYQNKIITKDNICDLHANVVVTISGGKWDSLILILVKWGSDDNNIKLIHEVTSFKNVNIENIRGLAPLIEKIENVNLLRLFITKLLK